MPSWLLCASAWVIPVSDFEVPPQWKPKHNADGGLVADCWTTPAGYTVALTHRPHMPVAVIRAGESDPFAYVPTLTEVPVLIAADLYASMSPAFKKAFDVVNQPAAVVGGLDVAEDRYENEVFTC